MTGRQVYQTSGPQYSDVDIADTSSQDSPTLLFNGGSKFQYVLVIAYQRDTTPLLFVKMSHCIFPLVRLIQCRVPSTQRMCTGLLDPRAIASHQRMGLRSLEFAPWGCTFTD